MARTSLMVNREQFINLLKDLKQKWIDDFDAHAAEVEAHNDAVPALQAEWWKELQKIVKKAAGEISKHPGPDNEGSTYRMPYTETWSTNGTVGRGVVTINVPERPIKRQMPNRGNLDHYIQSVDNDLRLLEMGVDEKVRLSADLQHWLDPSWSDLAAGPLVSGVRTVPPCTMDVDGERYGGAYWDKTTFRVTLTRVEHYPTRTIDRLATLILEDSSGNRIERVDLTVHVAEEMVAALADNLQAPVRNTPLTVRVLWKLGGLDHNVTLDEELNEVHAWLRCALGLDEYPDDEWEY